MCCTRTENQRLDMILQGTIPAQSEIRRCMGSSMAEVFFEHCHPDSRQLLGVIPPLEGPREELWISPSDQLIQKVALVPPLTNKYIKACTHQGILGKKAMEKYERDLYAEMIVKYEEQRGEARNMFEAEKRRAIQLSQNEVQSKYEKYIEDLREEFEQKLQCALAEAFRKCTKSMQKAVVRERIEVTRTMLLKLRNEISYIINFIYEKFEDSIRAQKENMVADFNEIIRRERRKSDRKLEEMERKKSEALVLQRHELEMRNLADVTYVMCLERGRSSSEKHAIHLCFEKKIQALKTLLSETNNVLNLMKAGTEARETGHVKSFESKLPEVLQEFQKFINFAFKAVPGQAEYLLSLESLLKPEVEEKLHEGNVHGNEELNSLEAEANPQFHVVDPFGEKWIPVQLIPDLPKLHCTKDQLMSPIVKSEIDVCNDIQYTEKHRPDASVVSLNTYDSLPFCCLENDLYIRSDYRENKIGSETKTMSQLAEDSLFIAKLKEGKKSCKPEIIENITDAISSSRTSENSICQMYDN